MLKMQKRHAQNAETSYRDVMRKMQTKVMLKMQTKVLLKMQRRHTEMSCAKCRLKSCSKCRLKSCSKYRDVMRKCRLKQLGCTKGSLEESA